MASWARVISVHNFPTLLGALTCNRKLNSKGGFKGCAMTKPWPRFGPRCRLVPSYPGGAKGSPSFGHPFKCSQKDGPSHIKAAAASQEARESKPGSLRREIRCFDAGAEKQQQCQWGRNLLYKRAATARLCTSIQSQHTIITYHPTT